MQGDTLAPYLFIIGLDYALKTVLDGKENIGFTLKPRRYPAFVIGVNGIIPDTPDGRLLRFALYRHHYVTNEKLYAGPPKLSGVGGWV